MKNFLQTTLIAFSFIFIASCSSDDPEPTHEMGTWTLESFVVTGLPASYSYSESTPRSIGYYGFESYTIQLNEDYTYLTSIKRPGLPTGTIEGTWEISEDELTFITNAGTDDESSTSFDLVTNAKNQLWFSENINPNNGVDFFISDAVQDQLVEDHGDAEAANEYLAQLAQSEDEADLEELESYFSTPGFDLVYAFIKSE